MGVMDDETTPASPASGAPAPGSGLVTITYCTQCNWLLRAAWMAQELLSTFQDELGGLTLVPGTGGVFRITAGQAVVWNRATDGGFPEITELKRRVRDQIAPDRRLGHADRAAEQAASQAAERTASQAAEGAG
jgi:selenoprotein W-related protein